MKAGIRIGCAAALWSGITFGGAAHAATEEFTLQNVSITDNYYHQTITLSGTFMADLTTRNFVSGNIVATTPDTPCIAYAWNCRPAVFDSAAGALFGNNSSTALDTLTAFSNVPITTPTSWPAFDKLAMTWAALPGAGGTAALTGVSVQFFVPNSSNNGYRNYLLFASPGGFNSFTGTVQAVPEPSSWMMLLLGGALLAAVRRWPKRNSATL